MGDACSVVSGALVCDGDRSVCPSRWAGCEFRDLYALAYDCRDCSGAAEPPGCLRGSDCLCNALQADRGCRAPADCLPSCSSLWAQRSSACCGWFRHSAAHRCSIGGAIRSSILGGTRQRFLCWSGYRIALRNWDVSSDDRRVCSLSGPAALVDSECMARQGTP